MIHLYGNVDRFGVCHDGNLWRDSKPFVDPCLVLEHLCGVGSSCEDCLKGVLSLGRPNFLDLGNLVQNSLD